ncbi:hypothetical protein [Thalassoglobus sp.]
MTRRDATPGHEISDCSNGMTAKVAKELAPLGTVARRLPDVIESI